MAEPLTLAIAQAEVAYDQRNGQPLITFRMTPESAKAFADLTRDNVGRRIEFRVDGKVMMAPVVREPILGGVGQISGPFSADEGKALAARVATGQAVVQVEVLPP